MKRFKVLLAAMPDTALCFKRVGDIPNLGIASLAGNLPDGVDVKLIDLVVPYKRTGAILRELVRDYRPDLVGLSAMSYQYDSAVRAAAIVREELPGTPIALGGYHATLLSEEVATGPNAGKFDFYVRNEGEVAFGKLVAAIAGGEGPDAYASIPNLTYREGGRVRVTQSEQLLELSGVKLPNRDARVIKEFRYFGKRFDCVETSRGCTLPCNFCSITQMYGTSFRSYDEDRVVEDLRRLADRGVQGVLLVDDNVTLDVPRLKRLCEAIIASGLPERLELITQASVIGVKKGGPELARLMGAAGFHSVFLGIENTDPVTLRKMKKGDITELTRQVIGYLHDNDICVIGGFITGTPQDDRDSVRRLYTAARKLRVDHIIVQCVTPYPKTAMRQELLDRELVVNKDDFSRYNGFICNVRTEKMSERALARAMNVEYLKLYLNPFYLARSRFLRKRRVGSLRSLARVTLNTFNHVPNLYRNELFLSRGSV
ncbi:MAG: radical SAM protein [Acidobacteriota bacterium]